MKVLFIFFVTSLIIDQSLAQGKFQISNIVISGNKITKKEIIKRELTFNKGDRFSLKEINKQTKQSKENLINLKLFNFVNIKTTTEEKNINIIVELVERWYIWPYPILEVSERNFNVWWNEFKESNYSDFSRMNYGVYLVWENFFGKNQLLQIKYRKGFKEHYLLNYEIPYFNKEKTIGINFFAQQFRRKKTFYKTDDNQLIYFENHADYTTKDYEFQIDLLYRKDIRHRHKLEFHYLQSNIADSIKYLSEGDYLGNNKLRGDYYKLKYQYTNEQRDYNEYPLSGHYLNLELTKYFKRTSPVNYFQITGKIEQHIEINNRIFIGSSFKAKLSTGEVYPYFAQEGLGFNDYVRTYEYYVINGQRYWLSKTAIKYALVKKNHFNVPFVRKSQFKKSHFSIYLSIFSDLGYVIDRQNTENSPLANNLLFGKGISLDYVTYYDKILRIEFGINRLNEKGIFLHFTNPFGTNK